MNLKHFKIFTFVFSFMFLTACSDQIANNKNYHVNFANNREIINQKSSIIKEVFQLTKPQNELQEDIKQEFIKHDKRIQSLINSEAYHKFSNLDKVEINSLNSEYKDLWNNIFKFNLYTTYLNKFISYKQFLEKEKFISLFSSENNNLKIFNQLNDQEINKYTVPYWRYSYLTFSTLKHYRNHDWEVGYDPTRSEDHEFYEFGEYDRNSLKKVHLYDSLNASSETLDYIKNIELENIDNKALYIQTKQFPPLTPIVDSKHLSKEITDWKTSPLKLWDFHGLIPSIYGWNFDKNSNQKIVKDNFYISVNIPHNQHNNLRNYWVRFDHDPFLYNGVIDYYLYNFAYLPDFLSYEGYIDKYLNQALNAGLNSLIKSKYDYYKNLFSYNTKFKKNIEKQALDFSSSKPEHRFVDTEWWLSLYVNNTFDLDFFSNASKDNPYLSNQYSETNNQTTIFKFSVQHINIYKTLNVNAININNFETFINQQRDYKTNTNYFATGLYSKDSKPETYSKPINVLSPYVFHPFRTHSFSKYEDNFLNEIYYKDGFVPWWN
ncbi:hypothetical protein [Mycoplasma nasistruthionis]|uniref:DUF31 domain-containing protein n=1 Tax=Mycoplasma nasistruthionis TaxID=353852 RepID=A0A5B7XV73_9MOLU|nr:hypothetical protein [Mycoplasma nasistruthionis]QCZ36861.1 hypothetical protein FG904_02495 [Mycoplasma nasistruthionis]